MEIQIEDLQIGDEILILGQVPKYVKILELPVVKLPKPSWAVNDVYKTVRCHLNVTIVPKVLKRWNYKTKQYEDYTTTMKHYPLTTPPKEGGLIKKIDLNYHRLWLVQNS